MTYPIFSVSLDEAPDVTTISTLSAFRGPTVLISGALLSDDLSRSLAALVDAYTWLYSSPEVLNQGWIAAGEDWADHGTHNLTAAVRQGHTVIAGSDAGYWFAPHGIALHRELAALVEVGMSLQQAPAEPRVWDDLGLLAAGYRADLLVLSANPSADIDATRKLASVWLGEMQWSDGDLLTTPDTSGAERFYLSDVDCTGRCDLVEHVCRTDCGPTYDRIGSCDETCAPPISTPTPASRPAHAPLGRPAPGAQQRSLASRGCSAPGSTSAATPSATRISSPPAAIVYRSPSKGHPGSVSACRLKNCVLQHGDQ